MSWPLVKLGDCAEVVSGGTPKRDESAYWDGDIYWVTPKDLSKRSDIYLSKTPEKITELGLSKSSANLLPVGTVLFSSRAPIGHVAITKTEMCSNQGFKSLVPKEGLDSLYLYFCLKFYKTAIENLGNGATFKEVSKKVVENFEIPLPPLPIQKKIAAVLEKADNLRQQSQRMEQELNSLAQSVFLDMFGDPVKNPKNWEKASVKDLAEVQGGLQVTPKRESYKLEVPYLRVANCFRDRLDLSEVKYIKVTEKELERTRLKSGDMLIVEGHGNSKEIGRTCLWDDSIEDCTHQNHLIRVRFDTGKILPLFASNYFNSLGGRRQVQSLCKTTSGLNTISSSNVKSLELFVPPLEVQKEYVDKTNKILSMLTRNTVFKDMYDKNFSSLMQRAFKGELDLKDVA